MTIFVFLVAALVFPVRLFLGTVFIRLIPRLIRRATALNVIGHGY